jgi:hypothetical protein
LMILENSEESCAGEGTARAVAAGAKMALSAFTEWFRTVPMTTPIVRVAKMREKNRSFRFFMVSIILSKIKLICVRSIISSLQAKAREYPKPVST